MTTAITGSDCRESDCHESDRHKSDCHTDALEPAVRPFRRIAVAIEAVDDDDFVFHALDGDDQALTWSGRAYANTPDAALLDVFVRIRSEVDSRDRIRFLVKLPQRSPLWVHHAELQAALPRCAIQGPAARDGELMAAALAGLPDPPPAEEPPSRPPLTVAADGSVRGRVCGYGWLSSDGQYGLQGRVDSRRVIGRRAAMVAELRAIDDAVRRLTRRHLTIYCDNSYAVSMARKWMDGQQIVPDGYTTDRSDGRPAGLVLAQLRIHRHRDRLDIRWTRSHQGEPLNEGADALARLASRYATGKSELSPEDYRRRAAGLAEAFAAGFRRASATSPGN